jgi:hypothetical protein
VLRLSGRHAKLRREGYRKQDDGSFPFTTEAGNRPLGGAAIRQPPTLSTLIAASPMAPRFSWAGLGNPREQPPWVVHAR